MDGFISNDCVEIISIKGRFLSKSEWKDKEIIIRWRNILKHCIFQQRWREEYLIDYKITVGAPLRVYTINMRDEDLSDSNKFLICEKSNNAVY